MKKMNLSDIKKMNTVNLEADQMNEVFGGRAVGGNCTLDTITVTPSGSSNDGDDSWSGECSGELPAEKSLR